MTLYMKMQSEIIDSRASKGQSMVKYHGNRRWYNLEKRMPVVLLWSSQLILWSAFSFWGKPSQAPGEGMILCACTFAGILL